ncbi:MAG TPA: hypothetical protein VI942_10265 [Thermoanaerobaculia bacterium]|nr:hypothetical protein [Thermoanaerobaculia bacterium]
MDVADAAKLEPPGTPGAVSADDLRLDSVDGKSPADQFLDELMPPELEWREVVRRHPIPALLVAAGLGYWLGRSRRGAAVAEAVAGAVALGMTSRLGLFDAEEPPV